MMDELDRYGRWYYQVRFTLLHADYMPAELITVLEVYNAIPICQYDAFANYCREAEEEGVEHYPLYNWTIDTITNPEKKEKYSKIYSVYVDNNEIYDKEIADKLEHELKQFDELASVNKYDTNPANNPQPPKKLWNEGDEGNDSQGG